MDNEMAALEAQTTNKKVDSFESFITTDESYQIANEMIDSGFYIFND